MTRKALAGLILAVVAAVAVLVALDRQLVTLGRAAMSRGAATL